MTKIPVLAISKSGKATVYESLRAASRVLSGDGSDSRRGTITDRVLSGGGYVGDVWVQYSSIPTVARPRG